MGGEVREGHQAVRDGHHIFGAVAVHVAVAQYAAVGFAADPAQIAVIIGSRGADEGDVNLGFTRNKRADTAAVGTHDGKALELSFGNGLPDLPPDAGGFNAGNGSVLDHGHQRVVGLAEGGGGQGDVLEAHFVDLFHDHVDDQVALAEVVMEADGHAAVGLALDQGFVNVLHQL